MYHSLFNLLFYNYHGLMYDFVHLDPNTDFDYNYTMYFILCILKVVKVTLINSLKIMNFYSFLLLKCLLLSCYQVRENYLDIL